MGKNGHGTRNDGSCSRFRMRRENNMKTGVIQMPSAQLAERLSGERTVLLYQRAGYGASSVSTLERTPGNIAMELRRLLEQIPHQEKVILLAHSQGGLYAWKFIQRFPKSI